MSAQKFKFVSPGVFLNEIDNSQLPGENAAVGPVVIGRASQGPALQPVRIESMAEFIETFGNPIAGGSGDDVWREGNGKLAPSYAAYAVQAYLRNSGPVNFVRLLGVQDPDAVAGTAGEAGYGDDGRAYALLVGRSGSAGLGGSLTTSVGAIFYATGTDAVVTINASGSLYQRGAALGSSSHDGLFMLPTTTTGTHPEFTIEISSAASGSSKHIFNFNRSSDKFIRKVFNTNPTLTNISIADPGPQYWLGETFETFINENIITAAQAQRDDYVIAVAELRGDSASTHAADFNFDKREAQTGWFFSQQISQVEGARAAYDPVNMQRLFKFHGLGYGESLQKRFKISIQDIKPAPTNGANRYGTFTVCIRDIKDTDAVPVIVEKFSNCNLNPQSSNYISKKIGDTYVEYDTAKKRNRVYGNYPNISRYLRVEVLPDLDNGALDPDLLPFGFYGPPIRKTVSTKLVNSKTAWNTGSAATQPNALWVTVKSGSNIAGTFGPHIANVTLSYPKLSLRLSASDGNLSEASDAFFGVRTTRGASSTRFDEGVLDHLRTLPASMTGEKYPSSKSTSTIMTAPSFMFTLDDIVSNDSGTYYLSGSRKVGNSYTATQASYRTLLTTKGVDRFTAPLYGGHDGVDITEQDPFNNTRLGTTSKGSYAYASVSRAIDLVTDPEVIECNMMTMPGLTNASLTKKIIDTCEARSDALAVIDLPDVYTPPHEAKNSTFAARAGTLSTVVSTFEQRGINSSYGCTYYPWVMVYDEINDKNVWVPPSVIALGVFANTERLDAVWFAPAGFNRGGLTEGSAGLPVINVSEKLTSADRDTLYEAHINPIASFPSEGIVVFGQKTLQVTPSALDRINVRRLMIFVKKEISRIANNLLFDQNVQTTWLRFVSEVKPFLESVKLGFGLSDFAVVLDSSTTTPDLVDRNIMYAKIFLKPARAIEFIAIDFVITNTGAAFED